jgi:galactonate dehydratase
MEITALETLRPSFQSNVLFLRLHTGDGLTGLGEAFYGAPAVEAYLHGSVAPVLLGLQDPSPERVSRLLAPYAGYQGAGVETRGNGAVDLALWDLLGKRAGLPVATLLGGPVRDGVRVYNTCANPQYVSRTSRQESANWGHGAGSPLDDLDGFLTRPADLAKELLAEGVTAMKIWPFDQAAEASGGVDIGAAELAAGLRIVADIRAAVGPDMDVLVELHGLWSERAARKICQGLADYRPYWVEDALRPDNVEGYERLARQVDVPLALGEMCVGAKGFLPLLQRGVADVLTVDVLWTGGLTEARKVATLADAYGVAVAPHDCTGPVSLAACAHLTMSQPNGLIQETARAFVRTWYGDCAEGIPSIEHGSIRISDAPGLGVELGADLDRRDDVARRVTGAAP